MTEDARSIEFQRLYRLAISASKEGGNPVSFYLDAAKFDPVKFIDVGARLQKIGEDQAALYHFELVLAVANHTPLPHLIKCAAYNNIGNILATRGQSDEALDIFMRGNELLPNHPDCCSNISLIHQWRHDWTAAERWAIRALKTNPWHTAATFIKAMVSLLKGDYLRGFEEYECRWRDATNGLKKAECDLPEWDGTNGKNLWVYGEQGAGDSILMLRYASIIRARGIRQSWVFQKGLKPLVEHSRLVDEVFDIGVEIPPHIDCHIPAASLPRIFKSTMNTLPPAPYLVELHKKILVERGMYGVPKAFQVGICWRGSTAQNNDKLRSTSLDLWQPVLAVPGVEFHSLQVDGADEALLYPQIICQSTPQDWLETARRICSLDLVISVDTSIVHLAGALGIPCWVALHCRPYFVYPPGLDVSPWYPALKLFKQKKAFEWTPIFERIANELRGLVS